ncbi:DUF5060 domain-containing protein [Candidatus Binatia bacterium]|nr:DUF5060 domain-containing protein [Candidatus Binatia bacterium]
MKRLRPGMLNTFRALLPAMVLGIGACTGDSATVEEAAGIASHPPTVPQFGVFEIAINPHRQFADPFFALSIRAFFTSPAAVSHSVAGFYYGGGVWKVRFVPDRLGQWSFTYEVTGPHGFRMGGADGFVCEPSALPRPLRVNPDNPFRWVVPGASAAETPRPYFPLGLQDCVRLRDGSLGTLPVDGEFDRGSSRSVSTDDYLALFGAAGFNLLRFSQKNCSFVLYDDLDNFREAESLATDTLLEQARARGFRVFFGLFGYHGEWAHDSHILRALRRRLDYWIGFREEALLDPGDVKTVEKEKRFASYAIARWGAYVDFWELLNERTAATEWVGGMARHVRQVDSYRHPIATSWQRPELPDIDINSPHWYESESEHESDLRVADQAARWKAFGKPVIVGEQGNQGMNWDPLSARRMRIRAWTALFEEIGLIFWNTSWSKRGMNRGVVRPGNPSNIYLGPEERNYVRVLAEFGQRLDAGARRTAVAVSPADAVRAYGLRSESISAAYIVHVRNRDRPVDDLVLVIDPPLGVEPGTPLQADCIDPASGRPALSSRLKAIVPIRLSVPAFAVDLACTVKRPQPPE